MTGQPEIDQHPVSDTENAEEKRQEQFDIVAAENRLRSQAVAIEPEDDDDAAKPTLPFSKARCIALVATVTGASFLNTLSIQSVVIILPTIGQEIGIPNSRQQWVVSSYSLTFGCFLLLWGRIADIYGKRNIFILGSAFMAATNIANPFIRNEIGFNVFRGLQGLGAAANVPTAIGILGVTFPPGKAKNYAFSTYAAGAPLGSAFGNIISGFIASFANWKWVFGATGGIAIVITFAALFFIPPPPPDSTNRLDSISSPKSVDWTGGALITASILALLFALTEGNVVGWGTVWIYLLIVISMLLLAIFVVWQWYQEKHTTSRPLMKVSLFKDPRFSAAMAIMAMIFGAFNDMVVSATFLFQDYQALGALQTTLRFIPTGVCGAITAFVVSHLISRTPTWILLLFGNLSVSVSCLLFSVPIPPHTSYFAYALPAFILSVLGTDTGWPCLTLFTSKTLPQEDQAIGGALVNAMGQIGRAIGLAITTAIQTAVMARDRGVPVEESGKIMPWEPASLAGLRAGMWFNFALAICCATTVVVFFRGTGIVGKIEIKQRSGRVLGQEDRVGDNAARK
ncbi:drug resistance protein [Annulohypoxylon truncatum]|uniref:drug resistance protein n=1 Tax=Annulohypoxylon truncatum TaxID=327061 RepID=UPI0020078CF0|nr:drug resistance protein [Annulohypoxylon truncatum]KAI1209497.1 drug resistance protein [Annulohypoxylon truncatum]